MTESRNRSSGSSAVLDGLKPEFLIQIIVDYRDGCRACAGAFFVHPILNNPCHLVDLCRDI